MFPDLEDWSQDLCPGVPEVEHFDQLWKNFVCTKRRREVVQLGGEAGEEPGFFTLVLDL